MKIPTLATDKDYEEFLKPKTWVIHDEKLYKIQKMECIFEKKLNSFYCTAKRKWLVVVWDNKAYIYGRDYLKLRMRW